MRFGLTSYDTNKFPFWNVDDFLSGKDKWLETAEGSFKPTTEVVESEKEFSISVDLPGVREKNISVSFEDNTLKISGSREKIIEEDNEKIHRSERYYGKFERNFTLAASAINSEGIMAEFKDGVLKVTVPKSEAKKAKLISIKSV